MTRLLSFEQIDQEIAYNTIGSTGGVAAANTTPAKKFATNKTTTTCQSPKKSYDAIGMVVEEEEMVNLTLNETTGNVSIATKPQSADISKKATEPKSKWLSGQATSDRVVISCFSFFTKRNRRGGREAADSAEIAAASFGRLERLQIRPAGRTLAIHLMFDDRSWSKLCKRQRKQERAKSFHRFLSQPSR